MKIVTNSPCSEIPLGIYTKCTLTTMFGIYRPGVRKKKIEKLFNYNSSNTIN